jgi:hypothetical protein
MSHPNERLMSHYGTRDVFEQKTAESLLERLIPALVAVEMNRSGRHEEEKIHHADKEHDSAIRAAAMAEMQQAAQSLRHTPVPMIAPSYYPPGFDEGMVRMASIAVEAGSELAKEAGIGSALSGVLPAIQGAGKKAVGAVGGLLGKAPAAVESAGKTMAAAGSAAPGLLDKAKGKLLGPLGWKGNAALIGGTLGAGWLANKAVHKATGELGRESGGSPVYGGGRLGYNPPSTVNSWGTPQ